MAAIDVMLKKISTCLKNTVEIAKRIIQGEVDLCTEDKVDTIEAVETTGDLEILSSTLLADQD